MHGRTPSEEAEARPTRASTASPAPSRRARVELALAAMLGPLAVRFLCGTVRWRWAIDAESGARFLGGEPVIFALWHASLLPLVYTHRGFDIQVLVSQNKDGEIITRILERMGSGAVRGSSTRGGRESMRGLLARLASGRSIAIAPDGPRGPRERVQEGVVVAAALSGAPIVPLAARTTRRWQLDTWDRFEIPKPFSRGVVVFGAPIDVPRTASRDREMWCDKVARAITAAGDRALELMTGDPDEVATRHPALPRRFERPGSRTTRGGSVRGAAET